jgi:GNAT superfamily N-acetyltransferase
MPVAYDRPGGGSTTRAPKRKPTLYAPRIKKAKPKRKPTLYAPQIRKGPSSSAAVTHVPGLGAVTRPTPRMHQAARSVAKAPARKAAKAVTHVPGLGAATRPKPKQTAAQRERGAFTKHPVQGMLDAERRAIGALGALHASDPKKYETALAKAKLAERATAGPRGQTVEHFKGRTIGEQLTDRPVKKLPPKRNITVAGYRGQTMPKSVKASLGGDLLKTAVQNAPKNAGDILTGMPTSLVYAAAHPVQAVKDTAKEYKDIATNPEKAISERPVSTALAVSGVARAPGLVAGRVVRAHRGHVARKAGAAPTSNARPDAGLPGTKLKEPRKGSRGVYSRGHQRRADAQHGPGRMTAREIQRQVDEHYDLTQRHAQRARDKAARRAKAQGLSAEDTATRVAEAGQGAQRGMDSVFARRFGAHQRPSVGRRETQASKAERDATYEAKLQAFHAKEQAKAEVAARKSERGTPSAHQTHLEAQREAALAELAHHEREHLSAQVSHERARGNARVSTARRKTSPALADLHAQLKKAEKEVTHEKPADRVILGDKNRAEAAPTMANLTHHLPEVGKPGISREQAIDRGSFETTGQKLPRSDVGLFVARGEDGRIIGALESHAPHLKTDANGKIVERNGKPVWEARENSVVVDPAHRRQGIASKLYEAAEKDNIAARSPTHSTYTEEGAALVNAMRTPKLVKTATAQGVEDARAAVSKADRHFANVSRQGAAALRNSPEVAAARAAVQVAERTVTALERQLLKEEERASRLEGVTEGRHAAGRMTAAAGRATVDQAERIGHLKEVLHGARKKADAANEHLKSIEGEVIHGARQATKTSRASLREAERAARESTGQSVAAIREAIAAEHRRIAGVAPEQADALMGAIDHLDSAASAKRATRQSIRDLGEQIRAERGATRVNQRATVNAAQADRQAALAEYVARRDEHAVAKRRDIDTKRTAVTAPLTGAAKQGRIFEHRYDAEKVADRLNEAGHTVNLSDATVKSPVRFGYADEGVRLQRSGEATVPLEYTVIEVPGGRFAVVPHIAGEQKRLHGVVGTSKATNAMLLRDTRRGLTRAVLPFSAKWLGGQAGEAGLRALVEGAGPLDWKRLKLVVARMNEIEPGAGDEYMMRLPGTHFDVTGEARHALGAPTLAERYKGRWPEQPMAALTAAGQTLPGRGLKRAFEKWNEVVLGKVNNAIERGTISAMTGHAIKRDLMNDRMLGLTRGAIDDAARGLMDTPRQIEASRAAADMYGKYSNFSPEIRSAIAHWTPFLPWYINTLRFLKNTVRDHPVKASLAVSLNSATEEWRKQHGLSIYSPDGTRVPDWQLGSYPIFGNKLSRVGQFTPFGAFNDPVGSLGGLGLPQLSGALLAAFGDDWTGKPMRDGATGMPFTKTQKAIKVAASLGESMIPLSSQALRWSGLGPRYIDRKDPESIVPLRSRLARELPLWPLGDVGGGGGGGGADSGIDIPPVDIPSIDIPPVDIGG